MQTDYQKYIHKSRYARWRDEDGRRETWGETVQRYVDFFADKFMDRGEYASSKDFLRSAITNLEVMPSMRCLMSAGKALERDNVAGYNCAYLPIDHPRAFDEAMYILLCGTGVGYSVERQCIQRLPEVAEEIYETDTTIKVSDSKIGWASAFRELLSLLYSGKEPQWDVSRVRPAGSRLKTFGGRASGPEPLERLFRNAVRIFKGARGRNLTSLECHDLMCYIADTVVVGGVRRSACICLSNLSDDRMRTAKYGEWYLENPQRALANNSVAYTEKPDFRSFLNEWATLYKSKSGERGIVNREAFRKKCRKIGRDENHEWGMNPCGEIILRPNQFCNLTEVVIRPEDTLETLKTKVRYATILGTLQATLTDFRYLRPIWKKNTEEEALLGVSLTGIMDHPIMSGRSDASKWGSVVSQDLPDWLEELKQVAKETNEEWANILGINSAAAITCCKPSGTVSQLVDCSSGIHPRLFPYYIRTVRTDRCDPLGLMLAEQGVPYSQDQYNYYFRFPMKSPEYSTLAKDMSALEQLKMWKIYADYWCDHNPSQTIYYTEDTFMEVGQWVWSHFDQIGGLSFFPHTDNVYENNPYIEITKEKYEELASTFPQEIDWDALVTYEKVDSTTGTQEYACSALGGCEIA